jgi:outer membrane biosynthesis protein TonB
MSLSVKPRNRWEADQKRKMLAMHLCRRWKGISPEGCPLAVLPQHTDDEEPDEEKDAKRVPVAIPHLLEDLIRIIDDMPIVTKKPKREVEPVKKPVPAPLPDPFPKPYPVPVPPPVIPLPPPIPLPVPGKKTKRPLPDAAIKREPAAKGNEPGRKLVEIWTQQALTDFSVPDPEEKKTGPPPRSQTATSPAGLRLAEEAGVTAAQHRAKSYGSAESPATGHVTGAVELALISEIVSRQKSERSPINVVPPKAHDVSSPAKPVNVIPKSNISGKKLAAVTGAAAMTAMGLGFAARGAGSLGSLGLIGRGAAYQLSHPQYAR